MSPSHYLRIFIPEPNNRTDISLDALPQMIAANTAAMSSLVFLSYCAHTSVPRLLRLSILPIVLALTLHTSFGYRWPYHGHNVINWAQGMNVFYFVGKAADLAFAPAGCFVGPDTAGNASQSPRSILMDSIKALGSLRDPARGLLLSPQVQSMLPGEFVRQKALRILHNLIIFDVTETILKLFPRVASPNGGIFDPDLSLPMRYLMSTFLTLVLGISALAMIEMTFDTAAIVGVGIFKYKPSAWPPIMENPWKATSVRELWSRRWHQMLRRTCTLLGGTPGYWIGGRAGFVVGTFIFTGLIHEVPMYCTGHPFEWHPVLFFALHGVLVICEEVFEKATGKRVGGKIGRMWTYFTMIGFGQPLVDSWLRRCLGNAEVIPQSFSPTKLLLKELSGGTLFGHI